MSLPPSPARPVLGVDAGADGPAPAATTQQAMQGLFGRDAIYLVVWALQVGVAALSIPITTRLLGGSGFGIVTTALAIMQVLVAIGLFSLPTAIQRNYQGEGGPDDARRTITLAIVTATITLIVTSATGPYWTAALRLGKFNGATEYAVIWASLTAITFAALAHLRSRNRLAAFAAVSLIQSVVAVLVGILLIVFVERSGSEFILGEMLTQAVAAALALYLTRPLPLRRRDKALILSTLRYSSGLVPAAISGFLLSSSDRLIIRHDLPILQVARYGAVYNIAAIPILMLSVLDSVWLPRFFALRDDELLPKLLADSRDALYALLIPAILALSFAAPLVLRYWVTPHYHPPGLYLEVVTISVSAFPMAGFIAANRVLLIAGKTGLVGLCVVLCAAFNIAANIVLVPIAGIEGSAAATLAAYGVAPALVHVFSRRIQHLRPPPVVLMIGCAVAVAVAGLLTFVPSTGFFAALRIVATVITALIFAAMLQKLVAPGRRNRLLRVPRLPRWPA